MTDVRGIVENCNAAPWGTVKWDQFVPTSGYCSRCRAAHAQKFRKVLLKRTGKGPQWLNDQKSSENLLKMIHADLFGVHIEMPKMASAFGAAHAQRACKVLLKGLRDAPHTLKTLAGCYLKGSGEAHAQNSREVLLKGRCTEGVA